MSDLMEDQLRQWMNQLSAEIESLEQGWLEMRRFKSVARYAERAEKVEQAIDLLRAVRSEMILELVDNHWREKHEKVGAPK